MVYHRRPIPLEAPVTGGWTAVRTSLGALITSANESDVNHIERLLETSVVALPEEVRLIYDGAADSAPLRERLDDQGSN